MTLHEAIQQVLVKSNKSLSAKDIATILNENSLYTKKDGSQIVSSQIGARVKNYPHLFSEKEGLIFLTSTTEMVPLKTRIQPKIKFIKKPSNDFDSLVNNLMNPKNFKSIKEIEINIPDGPGLYCIRIINPEKLQPNFVKVLQERSHSIVYIGLASQSLKKRFLGQELRAKGHGTFFRSLGAVLGYTPERGSLAGKKNQQNYKFSKSDEATIIEWIDKNLVVNFVEINNNLEELENELLKKYLPLLNLTGNPGKLKEVTDLRNACKRIAIGIS